jgi:predicted secreted Zn-dependent protease
MVPYTITGNTSAELRAQMDRLGPTATGQHWDAVESWYINWRWPTAGDGSCELSSATVSVTNTVTSPVWTPPPGVYPALVAAWSRYMLALATHEKGHVDLVIAGVPSVLDALHKATCGSANSAANAVLDQIRQRNADYDAATNHGATQGARFPLGAAGGA